MALTSDKNNLTRRNKNGSLENKKDKAEEKKHVPDEHDSDHDGGDKKQTASEVDNEDVSNRSLLGFMLKRRHLVAALLALLASMVTTEVDPKTWQHEETGTFHRGRVEMFNYITDIQQIPEVSFARLYFPCCTVPRVYVRSVSNYTLPSSSARSSAISWSWTALPCPLGRSSKRRPLCQ